MLFERNFEVFVRGIVLISIIVPIYNIEQYLSQCIESIIAQTYTDIEIILVDDGSTDKSGGICDKYAAMDNRIQAIHKPNGGLVSARKAGILASRGEYVTYVDGDDWIEPDMYKTMYEIITSQNVDIVMCGRYEDTGKVSRPVFQGLPEGRYDKQALLDDIYPHMIIKDAFFDWGLFPGVWDKLFRRECVEKFQLEVNDELTMGEDAACAYPCLLSAESIYILHECLYHYRQTTSSMVKRVTDYDVERRRFHLLYTSVYYSLNRYKYIYDLREQWLEYVLFLMIPRADGLYKDFDKLDFLFPFPQVTKGKRIIIYGAGTYGQRLYQYLQRTGFCTVVLWVDRNYKELRKMNLDVSEPEAVAISDCNTIIIANTYARSRIGLYEQLIMKYPDKKIYMIDEEIIFSKQSKAAFGLIEEK